MRAICISHFWKMFHLLRKIEPVLVWHLLHFWIFCPSKNFVRIKTSDNRRNMTGVTEFLSLLLQFFDESLKQRVAWRYRDAVSCPSYSTLPASFFRPVFKLSSCWQYFSELSFSFGFQKLVMYIGPRMSHHIRNILLFRVKFGSEVEGLGFPGSRYALFLTHVVARNPLFIPSYRPVRKGLDFVPSKRRCAYDNSIVQIFPT